ncbi:MAG TPA: arabinan endo-1,5-alpha-L-arabinosidase [Jatrophihabitantaceae bacterium]|jgi:arabinan endo-1,5-alpha-L-arabinosidase
MFARLCLFAIALLTFGITTPAHAAGPTPQYPNPRPIRGFAATHDPSMVRLRNGSYEVFATHDGIEIYASPDRVHWHSIGQALPDGAPWADTYQNGNATDLWAPDVSFHHGKYYLYYAVSTFGSNHSAIGLATSRTARPGSWHDHGLVVATDTSDDANAIDPGLLLDQHHRWWLSYGSFWSGIKLIQLDPSTGKPMPDATVTSLAQRPSPDAVEGAYIVHHGSYYYLFASYDFCCRGVNSTYNVKVGRSTDPDGPYVDAAGTPMMDDGGTQVLATHGYVIGPGGQTVLRDRHRDWLVYHYYNKRDAGTPRLAINPLRWRDGWPVVAR